MQLPAILLALAALGGLGMVGMRLSGTPRPPTWMAMGHGGIAACGLLSLIYTAATGTVPPFAMYAIGVFVLAALGGVAIFLLFHLQEKPLPIPLIMGHGAIAITGYVLLLLAMFG